MAPMRESVAAWCQTAKGWCLDLFYHGRDFVVTNQRHWAAGSMFGLSPAASVFVGKSDIPWTISYAAVLGFVAGAVKYALQNWEKIIQYGGPTALTVLAITVFLFHGLSSWTSVFTWLPVFVSTTLLATVNIAPGVTEIVTDLGKGLFALIELGRPAGTQRDQATDVEQAQDLPPGMAEHPNFDYWRHRSRGSILSYIRRLPNVRNLEPHGEGIDESVELDGSSVSTTTEVRLWMQPLGPVPDLVPQYIAIAPISTMDEESLSFPQTPRDHPLEMPFSRRTPSPIVEEPPLELWISE